MALETAPSDFDFHGSEEIEEEPIIPKDESELGTKELADFRGRNIRGTRIANKNGARTLKLPDYTGEIRQNIAAAKEGNTAATEKLMPALEPYIDAVIVNNFSQYSDEYHDDMMQEGRLAILKDIKTIDLNLPDADPIPYLIKSVYTGLLKWERDNRLIAIPQDVFDMARKIKLYEDRALTQSGRIDMKSIRAGLDCSQKEFDDALAAKRVMELFETIDSQAISDLPQAAEVDPRKLPDTMVDREHIKEFFERFFAGMAEDERMILEKRFGLYDGTPHNVESIRRELGLGRKLTENILRRAIKKGLIKLRQWATSEDELRSDVHNSTNSVSGPDRYNYQYRRGVINDIPDGSAS